MRGGDNLNMSVAGTLDGRLTTNRETWRTALVVAAWLVTVVGLALCWRLLYVAGPDAALSSLTTVSGLVGLTLPNAALATLGAIVVLRGDSLRYGWLMMLTGAVSAIVTAAGFYSAYAVDYEAPLSTVAVWVQDLWMMEQMLLVLVLPALLPEGTVASPKWRRPFMLTLAAWFSLTAIFVLAERPATNFFIEMAELEVAAPTNPTGFIPVPEMVYRLAWFLIGLTSVAVGVGSLVTRWRHADSEMRQRLKWVVLALAIVIIGVFTRLMSAPLYEMGIDIDGAVDGLFSFAGVFFTVAVGLAVLRFRLYDVDLVINRTIVYSVLTAMIVATYVGVVVGIGALLPVEQAALALVATGFVAVGFAPLRGLVQGRVNRIMFGQRDDPYAVLTKMGDLLSSSGTPEETLQKVVETIAVSLKLPGAAIELEEDGEFVQWASYGEMEPTARVLPVEYQGEGVGRILVARRSPKEPLSSQDIELLKSVAQQTGAVARSVRLTIALQRSRERLVLAQEEERRRIRHDLHDELGPSLASQTFQLDAIVDRLESDPPAAKELLTDLKKQNKELVADIRRLVYELRPPALDELGIAEALSIQTAQFDRSGLVDLELRTRPDPLPDLPAAIEVAAYRITREAIINSIKHAHAGECVATLEATATDLVVTVSDDGVGIDSGTEPGVGMTSMRDRTEELGGTFEVASVGRRGTSVRASLPLMMGGNMR